jgi:hypothetical protein
MCLTHRKQALYRQKAHANFLIHITTLPNTDYCAIHLCSPMAIPQQMLLPNSNQEFKLARKHGNVVDMVDQISLN